MFIDCSSCPNLNAQRDHCPLHPVMLSFPQVNLRVRVTVWVRVRVGVGVRVGVEVRGGYVPATVTRLVRCDKRV